jgi:hypothetical protein
MADNLLTGQSEPVAEAAESAAPEGGVPESGVEGGAEFLETDQKTSGPGFLESIDARFDAMGLQPESEIPTEPPVAPPSEAKAPVEAAAEAPEAETKSEPESSGVEQLDQLGEDLAKEFPTADELKDTLDEKAVAKWGELRTELKDARQELVDLKTQLDKTENQSVASELETQLAEAQKKIEDYENDLSISLVEKSPQYKQEVAEPLQLILDNAEALAERNASEEISAEMLQSRIFDALAETTDIKRQNAELEQLTAEMPERDKMMLYRMVDDAAAIFARDTQLKNNAAETAATLEKQMEAQSTEEAKQQAIRVRAAVSKVYDKLESVLPDLGENGDSMETLKEKTLSDNFTELDESHQAYALSAGTVLPPLVKAVRARDVKIAELEKQLVSFRQATPAAAAAGGGVAVGEGSTTGVPEETGFLEAIGQRMGSI